MLMKRYRGPAGHATLPTRICAPVGDAVTKPPDVILLIHGERLD